LRYFSYIETPLFGKSMFLRPALNYKFFIEPMHVYSKKYT